MYERMLESGEIGLEPASAQNLGVLMNDFLVKNRRTMARRLNRTEDFDMAMKGF